MSRLADAYPMSFAAVQKHVAVLERAGLITKERHGRERRVHSDLDAVGRARQVLDEPGRRVRRPDRAGVAVMGRPRQLERWWGPPTHPATEEKHDLSVSGEVAYFMTGAGGERSRGWWRVTSVSPPSSLEFTDGFANEDGTLNAELPTTAVRMRLTEQDGRTRMELRFVFDSPEHMERLERWAAYGPSTPTSRSATS